MKIGIDVAPLHMNTSGMLNYVRYLLHGLAKVGTEHSFILYTSKALETNINFPENFSVRVVRLPFPKLQIWYQLGLPLRLRYDRVDVFLGLFHRVPLLAGIPTVLTVHDLSGLLLKDYHTHSVVARESLIPLFISKACRIIAVSKFTAQEIIQRFPGAEGKLDVILEAPAPKLTRIVDDTVLNNVRRDLNLPDRYILFLGTLEPRKNLPAFLKAFSSIAHLIPQDIVLTGRMGWGAGELKGILKNIDVRERIHLTGFVEDTQLPALITMAEIMAYPSLYEGFGLPVVEAMACGTPVLTSSVSSLPEAAGGAALLADPTSIEDMAEKLLLLAKDSELRNNLTQKGLDRTSKLSWENTALATLDVCKKALE